MLSVALIAAGLIYVVIKFNSSGSTASSEDSATLRSQAISAGDAMAKAFEDSHTAYAKGDGKRAKELSEEGKKCKAEMESLNARASEMVFAGVLCAKTLPI